MRIAELAIDPGTGASFYACANAMLEHGNVYTGLFVVRGTKEGWLVAPGSATWRRRQLEPGGRRPGDALVHRGAQLDDLSWPWRRFLEILLEI